MDDATLEVARGQSSFTDRGRHYGKAIEHLEKYREVVDCQLKLGRVTSEQAALLNEYEHARATQSIPTIVGSLGSVGAEDR